MTIFKEHYEFTLQEMFSWHKLSWSDRQAPARNSLESKAFIEIEKKPLNGLMYQAARTSTPISGSIWEAMEKAGVGPAPNVHDKRTGVIIFDGDQIVGSMTDAGICNPTQYSLFVHPDHRDKDIAQLANIALWIEFPRHLKLGSRVVMNQYGAYATVSAFVKYIKHCQEAGKPVPKRVVDNLESDAKLVTERIGALRPHA